MTRTDVRISNRRWQVNWGKSFPVDRGFVEYINIKLDQPRDVTLYLGQPNTQMFGYVNINPFLVSVGAGGTSFNYELGTEFSADPSVRGNVLHFVCDELYVRGQTNGPAVYAPGFDAGSVRFGAQAGLGRPSDFERMQWQGLTANGDSELDFRLTPWSTHARFDYSGFPAGGFNPIDAFTVRQENLGPGGVTSLTGEMPLSQYLSGKGCALHPWANRLILTTTGGGGPPPAGPPAGATYQFFLTEHFVY